MDVPSGCIRSFAEIRNGEIMGIGFHNVTSFIQKLNATVKLPEFGEIKYDLAFGEHIMHLSRSISLIWTVQKNILMS